MSSSDRTERIATDEGGLRDQAARTGPLFGANPGSVKVRSDVDLIQSVIDQQTDAESGRETRR